MPTSFDDAGVSVVARDDAHVALEFTDKTNGWLLGVVKFAPNTAIEIGQLLVSKGTSLRDQVLAQAEAEEGPVAWTDRNGVVWAGVQHSPNMQSVTDHQDLSWSELLTRYGPLTPFQGGR